MVCGSTGFGWGEQNRLTTQGLMADLDQCSTSYPTWSDVGSSALLTRREPSLTSRASSPSMTEKIPAQPEGSPHGVPTTYPVR